MTVPGLMGKVLAGKTKEHDLRTQSLLLRTAMLSALISLLLCVLLASLAIGALREQERNLREESLQSGIDEMQAHLSAGGWPDLHNDRHVVSAVRNRQTGEQFLPALQALGNGLHELQTGSYPGFSVLVVDRGDYQLLYGIDFSVTNRAHQRYLQWGLVMIALSVLIAAALGYFYARRLALRVNAVALQVRQRSADDSSPIARAHISEIDTLVDAVNQYRGELAVARLSEQTFLADVSHALRTPVAVLQSSLDLLGQTQAQTPAWQRADRNVRDLRIQLDALLLSARSGVQQASEPIALQSLIDELLQGHPLRAETVIDLEVPKALSLRARARVLHWVLQQCLRSFEHCELITLRWQHDRLILQSNVRQPPQLPSAHLLQCVCDREDWQLRIESDQLQIIFPESALVGEINGNLR
jgi:signal transduction histidine kinase